MEEDNGGMTKEGIVFMKVDVERAWEIDAGGTQRQREREKKTLSHNLSLLSLFFLSFSLSLSAFLSVI